MTTTTATSPATVGLTEELDAVRAAMYGRCYDCGTTGLTSDGRTCPTCGGLGHDNPRHDLTPGRR